ncbi:glycosyl transferase [Cellulomonas sp. WB94]|uniref:glycosyltransferase family 2 protein n=1 Tax=Cellulomonas sp. WB94 TaxID=2173174 RepID=UPI000D56FEE5|nr:glycosyltransferase family 2 protein [Cellulomonas sp. WB94]PVU82117.1 glycosyl transferase [Cellulomonas sp. WB94]
MAPTQPDVSVIVLAYGDEKYLGEAIHAVLASTGVHVEIILVDNGCSSSAVRELPLDDRISLVTPSRNLGFAGGVNFGAARARADVLAFVNSDATVEPTALAELVRAVADPGVGLASGQIRLAGDPGMINSAGNPLHVLGLSWAGHMNEPVALHSEPGTVTSISGACAAVRREVWEQLGGFPVEYFAYLEDLELSWRCWQRGLRVEYVPSAVANHHYDFSRSDLKMYLVERNRLIFLATCYESRTLLLLGFPLVIMELALVIVAAAQGWAPQKIRGWRWILSHLTWLRSRRSAVQSSRTIRDKDLAYLLTDKFDPAQFSLPSGANAAQGALRLYWRCVRRLL